MLVNVHPKYPVGMKNFSLSHEDAQEKKDCRLRIKWFLWKIAIKMVCVIIFIMIFHVMWMFCGEQRSLRQTQSEREV